MFIDQYKVRHKHGLIHDRLPHGSKLDHANTNLKKKKEREKKIKKNNNTKTAQNNTNTKRYI
jgi:hypothetical protein